MKRTKQTDLKTLRRALDHVELTVRKKDDGLTEFTLSASSEAVVERWFGREILVHESAAIRSGRLDSGSAPLLFNHNADDPVGMVRSARIVGRRLQVDGNFFATARAKEVETMVDGGLRNVSLAYQIHETEEERDGNNLNVRVTDWEPYEVSIVTIPADYSVGIGRQREDGGEPSQISQVNNGQPAHGVKAMEENQKATAGGSAEGVQVTRAQEAADQRSAIERERDKIAAIQNMAKASNIDEGLVRHWVGSGASIKDVSDDILKIIEERANVNPQPATKLGLTPKEVQSFSLFRAVLAAEARDWSRAGFEAECSREIAKKLDRVPDPKSFFVPFEVMSRCVEIPTSKLARRDLTVGTTTAGGFLVETVNVGFVELLRNRSIAYRMGARRLPGLQGSITIPRQTGAASAVWLASESSQITESDATFGQIAMSPKSVGAYQEVSRQLMLQSSPNVEGLVTSDLATVAGLAVDVGVLRGSGASGQPTGIVNTAGIGAVTGTSLGYAGILEFQSDVAAANVMPSNGGYATTPAVAALLKQRARFANTDTPLWQGNIWDGEVEGFSAMSSPQMTAASMLFGDWSQVVVGEWGVLQIDVNPFANFQAGIIGIRAIVTIDVALRYPGAFSLASTIT